MLLTGEGEPGQGQDDAAADAYTYTYTYRYTYTDTYIFTYTEGSVHELHMHSNAGSHTGHMQDRPSSCTRRYIQGPGLEVLALALELAEALAALELAEEPEVLGRRQYRCRHRG